MKAVFESTTPLRLALRIDKAVTGTVWFESVDRGVLVKVFIAGLVPGTVHGMHIHENAYDSKLVVPVGKTCCDMMGGHFNPYDRDHGSMRGSDPESRHVGDLCNNIVANDAGVAQHMFVDTLISLDKRSRAYIGGRSLVLHAFPDDEGSGGLFGQPYFTMPNAMLRVFGRTEPVKELLRKSIVDGNAGRRMVCAAIV